MKKLIFVTGTYPYGKSETFIENEIKYLAEAFDKVYIFSTEADKNENMRLVPENVTVFPANRGTVTKKDYIRELIKPECIKEIFKKCIGKKCLSKIAAVCYFSACVNKSLKKADDFIDLCDIKSDDTVTVYSYWLSTIGMCAIKISNNLKSKGIDFKFVSRCHGFDVNSESTHLNYLPFQKTMISQFEKIYPCSNSRTEYLKTKFPDFADKISTAYLGVSDKFSSSFPTIKESFNIVSCSNVIPIKRVGLFVKALSLITDKKINWTHFGDGELFEDIKKEAKNTLPPNISAFFAGRIPNTKIYDFYNNNNVNLFINVSADEGLPVSIMEAVSFGIPVVATDVGGTGELVKSRYNGILLDEHFDVSELAKYICEFIDMEDTEYEKYCNNARLTFENNFNAEKNYTEFSEILKGNKNA